MASFRPPPSTPPPLGADDPFDLDRPLLRLSENAADTFTLRQACEGVQIFGGIGSGKTSGSGRALAHAYLEAGMGGVVLCAKRDALDDWLDYAAATGRSDDLLIVGPEGEQRFNFLDYEMRRPGGPRFAGSVVNLLTAVHEAMERQRSASGVDPYWERALQQLTRNAVDLCILTEGTLAVPLLHDIVMSAPRSPREVFDEGLQESSTCLRLLNRGARAVGEMDRWARYDFDATRGFWLREFPNLAPETRAGVVSMFTTVTDAFLRRPFRRLFCSDTTFVPELSHEGLVIVLALPVKEFGSAGRAAQVMFKYIWQQATERRDVRERPRPCFLWVDESQNFVTSYDMHFQATARSSRACTVFLTQNLPNYNAEMGGEEGRARVESLVGNLQTRIFHANGDVETNRYAAEVIGKCWQRRSNAGLNSGAGPGQSTISRQESESFEYEVPPRSFTTLMKGGPPFYRVEGIVFQTGRVWSNGANYLPVTFKQEVASR